MKRKHYKPGQLVTIDGKVYRIKRKSSHRDVCSECAMSPLFCNINSKVIEFCASHLPYRYYLEPVKPKQK